MKSSFISLYYGAFILFILILSTNSQCCLKFNNNQCVSCPDNMHIYRANCIFNLPNCKAYSNGFDCSQCQSSQFKLQSGLCIQLPKPLPIINPKQTLPQTSHPQFKQVQIPLPLDHSSSDDTLSRASVVEDIFRTTYNELRDAVLTKATDRIYNNGTKYIDLMFKTKTDEYEGIMMADMNTFIFKQISYKKVEKNLIVPESESKNHAVSNSSYNSSSSTINQSINNPISSPPSSNNNNQSSTQISNSNSPTSFNSNNTSSSSFNNSSNLLNTAPTSNQSASSQQYASLKFVQLSDIQALMDINFIVGLNEINNKIAQLQGLQPYKIFVQQGHNLTTFKGKFLHYIIQFQIQVDGKDKIQEVKLKVDPVQYSVIIDSVEKKDLIVEDSKKLQSQSQNSSQPSLSASPSKETQASLLSSELLTNSDQTLCKKNFTQTSSDPPKSSIYVLLFLDNLSKQINKTLSQSGQRLKQLNQILYAGELQASENMLMYWIETRVVLESGEKKVYKVRGTQNKLTYEINITEITLIDQTTVKKGQNSSDKLLNGTSLSASGSSNSLNSSIQSAAQNTSQSNSSQSAISNPNKQHQENNSISKPIQSNQGSTSSQTTLPTVDQAQSASSNIKQTGSNSGGITTTASAVILNPISASNTTREASPALNNLPTQTTNSNKAKQNLTNIQPSGTPKPSSSQISTQSVLPSQQNVSSQNVLMSLETTSSINQTIYSKAGGFDQIQQTDYKRDLNMQKVIQTLLPLKDKSSNNESKQLYKVFMKNLGIKAEFKIYFIELNKNTPKQRINIYQGYATYDMIRKRVFVISFGAISG